MAEPRPLIERLTEYADATRGLVPQLEQLLPLVSDAPIAVPGDTPIKDAIRLYGLIADDLDKLVRGEELKPFIVTGRL